MGLTSRKNSLTNMESVYYLTRLGLLAYMTRVKLLRNVADKFSWDFWTEVKTINSVWTSYNRLLLRNCWF